ncbi:S1C family serine protease [Paramagnetospirillum kuznetsovii]|nr:trypsin-like peptidase domain-containing protein [Paramagnetospirillum kuznetsovii]
MRARTLGRLGLVLTLLLAGPAHAADQHAADLRALLDNARAAEPDAADLTPMAIAPATSQQLLRQGDIDFQFSVGIDLPIDLQPKPLSSTVAGPMAETGRHVIVFDVALAKASRKVRDVQGMESQKVVEMVRRENPAYKRALAELDKAGLRAERYADKNQPIPPKIANILDTTQAKLASIPPFLETPVYGKYTYKAADVDAQKTLTVHYYVIDKQAKRYIKSTFDVMEAQHFIMAYDMADTDPNKGRIHADHSFEKDVRDWERAAVIVPLSKLLNHALQRQGEARSFTSVQPLLAELARDRSTAAARLESERFDARPLNDPRFDSVVAIFRHNALGSGFYVRSNIVMTNWHVVNGSDIVELKRYDGRETFGQVIARDTRLDLALIKVQDRGRPVEFAQGREIKPGDVTEVIGHPNGYAFTITRGLVSGIRRLKPAIMEGVNERDSLRNVPNYSTPHHKDGVLYIQTDAAINNGNSGGPMFVGNKVVGISDWGQLEKLRSDSAVTKVPGLNFTVHYSEAQRFITDALKGE